MKERRINRRNSEGYNDPTTYAAMTAITQEEQVLEAKVGFLIKVLRFIIQESGFKLLNRIEVEDSKTGRCFR